MRIGIMGAMAEEIQLLMEEIEIVSEQTIGMRNYYNGLLYGKEVTLVYSRCGKVAAASTATTLIQQFDVDVILFTGVAGGGNENRRIGDVVISNRLIQHDMDASGVSEIKKFEIPLLNKSYFTVDNALLKQAVASANAYLDKDMRTDVDAKLLKEFGITLPKVAVGTVASGDQFIADGRITRSLAAEIDDLECVEMEGAAVAQVCYEYGVKFMVFRVISDNADEKALFNFNRFIEKTASHFTRGIVKRMIRELQ